ncbi:4a-hydroxytetrahydrobiopterin dehydratase [Agitococcus lubricus]|uniref:4a-hydroxytetrahydrobiopterin dehydratase n=1 Tax=Agitococcus lubricus TaxID=1077255 RepID=A0A2T5J0M5_9GAMM|nr:4a-hydroxytetrahydrobiopterin dehydratase [Agitococcus lubricus]PTQ89836.1 4a-hydroxytetrahydrobiopterin dehydratase [Agitococcus lubricus]
MNHLSLEPFFQGHPDWRMRAGKLHREYCFKDFNHAFAFMTQVAMLSERMNHHPDWSNSYNRVIIDLITHDAQSVTGKDISLAVAIEQLWQHKL